MEICYLRAAFVFTALLLCFHSLITSKLSLISGLVYREHQIIILLFDNENTVKDSCCMCEVGVSLRC